jgi:hypothetical protein
LIVVKKLLLRDLYVTFLPFLLFPKSFVGSNNPVTKSRNLSEAEFHLNVTENANLFVLKNLRKRTYLFFIKQLILFPLGLKN